MPGGGDHGVDQIAAVVNRACCPASVGTWPSTCVDADGGPSSRRATIWAGIVAFGSVSCGCVAHSAFMRALGAVAKGLEEPCVKKRCISCYRLTAWHLFDRLGHCVLCQVQLQRERASLAQHVAQTKRYREHGNHSTITPSRHHDEHVMD